MFSLSTTSCPGASKTHHHHILMGLYNPRNTITDHQSQCARWLLVHLPVRNVTLKQKISQYAITPITVDQTAPFQTRKILIDLDPWTGQIHRLLVIGLMFSLSTTSCPGAVQNTSSSMTQAKPVYLEFVMKCEQYSSLFCSFFEDVSWWVREDSRCYVSWWVR